METTIKISKETRERILSLDLSEKGKSFDMIVNDMITFYQKSNKKYSKDYKNWEKSFKEHQKRAIENKKEVQKYKDSRETWDKLLLWARSKGFKE